jgi:hypothetical protein
MLLGFDGNSAHLPLQDRTVYTTHMRPKIAAILSVLFIATNGWAQARESRRPGLIVFIVVDQFREDYLTLLEEHFVTGGFKRFLTDGARFTNAYLDYGVTATGPGHASLATGAVPSRHGIVGNVWLDANTGRRQYCCGDDGAAILGSSSARGSSGRSPRWLEADTLGDRIKIAGEGRAKVWSVSLKDRSAILTAGKRADGAVWWDKDTGRFVSSSHFGASLPKWAAQLNNDRFADGYFKKSWDLILPESAYPRRFFDKVAGADVYRKWHSGDFPKILGRGLEQPAREFYRALYVSPFGNELVFECARRAIEHEKLGADEYTDLLNVCLSSNDAVGHRFGPDSRETIDCTIRTDRQLAEFFAWLDLKVGLDRCVVTLTADHGVGPIPEFAAGLDEGGGRLNADQVAEGVNRKLAALLGTAPEAKRLVAEVMFPWLYLDESAVESSGFKMDEVARLAAEAARSLPGIEQAVASVDIGEAGSAASRDLRRLIENSYYPGRSGQVYLHWARYWYADDDVAGHGAAHD